MRDITTILAVLLSACVLLCLAWLAIKDPGRLVRWLLGFAWAFLALNLSYWLLVPGSAPDMPVEVWAVVVLLVFAGLAYFLYCLLVALTRNEREPWS